MRVALLGPLEVEDGGRRVAISAAKERAVLALLALRDGAPVSIDELVDALWGDDPPKSARKAVQTYVAQLRHKLAKGSIDTSPHGYSLRADEVDAGRFTSLLARGRSLVSAGDEAGGAAALAAGLALWRGRPLVELADHHLGAVEVVRLEELRRTAEEDLADLRLSAGDHEAMVAALEAAVREEPLRERRWGQLMTALYRCGRQADALRAYQRCRRHLGEELGLEPGAQLEQLEQAMLAQSAELAWTAPRVPETTQPLSQRSPSRRLPVAANSFVGRRRECAAIEDLLNRARLVTITGPGGCGKTRIALEVANLVTGRLDDGASMVQLADVRDDRDVELQLAAEFGVAPEPDQSLVATLAAALAERRLLIVLDNCEHVVAAAARVAETLVASCRHVSILATSREALRCPSEHRFTLDPLSADAAVELFTDRARAAQPEARLDDHAQLIGHLCRQLDCLPLALEIAAARLEAMTPSELVAGLDDRFAVLIGGPRTVDDRHRTLRAAIDWSYGLLNEAEQRLLRRLSVFVGGVGYSEVAAMCGSSDPTGLLQKSLVFRTDEASVSRLHLHESIRQYGLERLEGSGEAATARRAHGEAYLALAESSAPHLRGPDQRRWFARLDAERGNIGAALAWASQPATTDPDAAAAGLRLCLALWWYWFRTNQAAAGLAWLDATMMAAPADDATALGAAGYLAWIIDDFGAASSYAERALTVADAPPASRALALGVQARILGDRGEFSAARQTARASEDLYLVDGDPWTVAWARRCRASCALYGGDTDEAQELTTDAMNRFDEIGDGWAVAGCLDLLAVVALRRGDIKTAFNVAQESVSRHRDFADITGIRTSLLHLADVARQAGDGATAERAGRESLDLSLEHGYRMGAMHAHLLLAEVVTDKVEAVRHARESAILARQLGDDAALAEADAFLATAAGSIEVSS